MMMMKKKEEVEVIVKKKPFKFEYTSKINASFQNYKYKMKHNDFNTIYFLC